MVSGVSVVTVAALFVDANGIYSVLPGVDVWSKDRDARAYMGPFPVVAHPPCERWGRWWWADGSDAPGNDEGCFVAALSAVERFGGVLEHPAFSHAWARFGLPVPDIEGGWKGSLLRPGCSAHVAQRNYGHRARKDTWLYAVAPTHPALVWGAGDPPAAYLCRPGRTKTKPGRVDVEIMGPREAAATPAAFAELLLSIARSCR